MNNLNLTCNVAVSPYITLYCIDLPSAISFKNDVSNLLVVNSSIHTILLPCKSAINLCLSFDFFMIRSLFDLQTYIGKQVVKISKNVVFPLLPFSPKKKYNDFNYKKQIENLEKERIRLENEQFKIESDQHTERLKEYEDAVREELLKLAAGPKTAVRRRPKPVGIIRKKIRIRKRRKPSVPNKLLQSYLNKLNRELEEIKAKSKK